MKHDSPPPLRLQVIGFQVKPYDAYTEAKLSEFKHGQVLTAKASRGRRGDRNSAYWCGLLRAIKACEHWPTDKHLHSGLKMACGYVEEAWDPISQKKIILPQSTAFDKMPEAEFAAFFEQAQKLFIETMGFDPWERSEP